MDSFFDTVTHRWPVDREDVHWHILFDPEITQKALLDPYAELLAGRDGLAPVAATWLHTTLLHSGPTAEFTEQEVSDIVALVTGRCAEVAPFELTFDRPSPGRVAVECAATPGEPARRLWRLVADATGEVTGHRFPLVPDVYYPHMSLGYGIAAFDHRPMKAWLSDHPLPPVTLPVRSISLVSQQHDGRNITWRNLANVTLTG